MPNSRPIVRPPMLTVKNAATASSIYHPHYTQLATCPALTHHCYTRTHARTHIRTHARTHTHTHTHPFNGPLSGTTRVSRHQNGKPIWILLKQETVSGSGISWATGKSAPRSRQITTPAPHRSVFYRPDALPAAQPTASKHCRHYCYSNRLTSLACWAHSSKH